MPRITVKNVAPVNFIRVMNFLANGWVRPIERYCQSIVTDEELSININIATNAIHHCSCIRLRRFRQIHLRHIAKEFIFLLRYGVSRVRTLLFHYSDFIMGAMASQITNVWIVCSTVCSGADQRIHQSSVSLAFARGIPRCPVDIPPKGPVTR